MRVGDAEGVGGGAVAENFAVDFRAAGFGVIELFEDDHGGAFAEDEAIAIFIEGARGFGGGVVAGGEGGEQIEAGDAEGMDHAVRAAGEHDVGFAAADDLGGFADGLAAGGAGGEAVGVGALGVEHRGQMRGGHVGLLLELGHGVQRFEAFAGEGADVERVAIEGAGHHAAKAGEILLAFAAAEIDAEARGIAMVFVEAGVLHRLLGGAGGEARVAAAIFPAVGIFAGIADIPVFDFGGNLRGELAGVEKRGVTDAGFAAEQACHIASTEWPSGVTQPRPVMTTRRFMRRVRGSGFRDQKRAMKADGDS